MTEEESEPGGLSEIIDGIGDEEIKQDLTPHIKKICDSEGLVASNELMVLLQFVENRIDALEKEIRKYEKKTFRWRGRDKIKMKQKQKQIYQNLLETLPGYNSSLANGENNIRASVYR